MSTPPSHEAKGYLVLRADTNAAGTWVRGLNIVAQLRMTYAGKPSPRNPYRVRGEG